MNLRYKCLILDHDDTMVDSTALIHYPSFLHSMARCRPGVKMTLAQYFEINCDPGIIPYFRDVLKLSEEEMAEEYQDWLDFSAAHHARVYPGMAKIARAQKELGGYICVVSHNREEAVLQDYQREGLPRPDLIYGCDRPKEEQKPHTFPLEDICARLGLEKQDLFMIDDLIPGMEMCRRAGVAVGAARWAHRTPIVGEYLTAHGVPEFSTPQELYQVLFVEKSV